MVIINLLYPMVKAPEMPNVRPPRRHLLAALTAVTACVAVLLPLLYWAMVCTAIVAALWHGHQMVHAIVTKPQFDWRDALAVLFMLIEAWVALLLVRQLLTPSPKEPVFQSMMPVDQPGLHQRLQVLTGALKVRSPRFLHATSGAEVLPELQLLQTLLGRGPCLRIGLSIPAWLTEGEFLGLLVHQLSYSAAGRGALSFEVIRSIDRWFDLRILGDRWGRIFREGITTGRLWHRFLCAFAWITNGIALQPLKVLHRLLRLTATPAMRGQLSASDHCACQIVGGETFAQALVKQKIIISTHHALDTQLKQRTEEASVLELPDNLPQLVGRCLERIAEPEDDVKAVTHWLPWAPLDATRIAKAKQHTVPGIFRGSDSATLIFMGFHEIARRATCFHYQNDWQIQLGHLRLITAEEVLYHDRASAQTLDTVNRYFKGLIHPERSVFGHGMDRLDAKAEGDLRQQLSESRRWLIRYGSRNSTLLREWSRGWRFLRDLECACVTLKAGLQVPKKQFAADTIEELHHEVIKQRANLQNLEDGLRLMECQMENRMASCLELLWREQPDALPPTLSEARKTLPHWVMVYEALGLPLANLRELMTQYNAFSTLGANIAGRLTSDAYVATLKNHLPGMLSLSRGLVQHLSSWSYPFRSHQALDSGARLSMSDALGFGFQEITALERLVTQTEAHRWNSEGQAISRAICSQLGSFMDRYLHLYHQSSVWISRTTQLAEGHFIDPAQERMELAQVDMERTKPLQPA